jgi:hypothetical protein
MYRFDTLHTPLMAIIIKLIINVATAVHCHTAIRQGKKWR